MSGKKYTPEDVVRKLQETDVLLSQGVTMAEVVRRLGVNKVTNYRWRREFGGMKTDQARRLKDLEQENARPKKLVADLSLDNAVLKEVASGNW
jgi:transposase-like protein